MTLPIPPQLAEEHDRVYREGWALLNPYLLLHDRLQRKPGWLARRRLLRAEQRFVRALEIAPGNWSSMWALGKLHQCLGRHDEAFAWLLRAVESNPAQPDVLREAGLEALESDHHVQAIELLEKAASIEPDNAGHRANLALALLVSGALGEARRSIEASLELDPADVISQRIERVIGRVASGSVPAPRSVADVMRALGRAP